MPFRPTTARIARRFALLACALAAGCSAHHGKDLVVGKDGAADAAVPGAAGQAGRDTARSGTSAVAAGGNAALAADIENREGVALDVVTVACAGDCFEVIAVARGGYPPYAYRWEDGSTGAVRKLCPDASRAFEVKATDHGYDSEEFRRAPETVTAAITAEVLVCPDAGMPDSGSEPPSGWTPLCIPNGSFEETSSAQWRHCPASVPAAAPEFTTQITAPGYPAVLDGLQYLRMAPQPGQPVTISVPLCAPVSVGVGYYWTEAWTYGPGSGQVRLEFFLSKDECGLDGKLSEVSPVTTWTRVCSAWPATWDAEWLTIRAVATSDFAGEVFLDEFLEQTRMCPPPE